MLPRYSQFPVPHDVVRARVQHNSYVDEEIVGKHPAWKKFERRVARFFGAGGRTPLSGGNSMHTRSDTLHDFLFIECKQRAKHAVISLWNDIKPMARKENKIPVVCLSEKGRKGFWVMVHSDDLLAVANQREQAAKGE